MIYHGMLFVIGTFGHCSFVLPFSYDVLTILSVGINLLYHKLLSNVFVQCVSHLLILEQVFHTARILIRIISSAYSLITLPLRLRSFPAFSASGHSSSIIAVPLLHFL